MGTADNPQNPVESEASVNAFESTKNTGQNDYKDVDKETIESTRSKLAMVFVLGFFATIFLCFVFARIQNTPLKDLKDTIVAIIGSLSGIFGFIIGYYYKSDKQ